MLYSIFSNPSIKLLYSRALRILHDNYAGNVVNDLCCIFVVWRGRDIQLYEKCRKVEPRMGIKA